VISCPCNTFSKNKQPEIESVWALRLFFPAATVITYQIKISIKIFGGAHNKCQPQMPLVEVKAKVEMFSQKEIGLYAFLGAFLPKE